MNVHYLNTRSFIAVRTDWSRKMTGFDQPKCKHAEVALVPGPGRERRSRVWHVGLSAVWQCIKLGKTAALNTGASQVGLEWQVGHTE